MNKKINAPRTKTKHKQVHEDSDDELLRQSLFKEAKVLLAHKLSKTLLLSKKTLDLLRRQTLIRRNLAHQAASQFLDYTSRYFVA